MKKINERNRRRMYLKFIPRLFVIGFELVFIFHDK